MSKGVFGLLLFIWASTASAQNYVQSFEMGNIDWSNGIVEAVGLAGEVDRRTASRGR